MADGESTHRDRPTLSLGSDDWPATVADKIVEVVDAVRVQTTDRAVFLLRAVVYCLVAAVAAIAAVVLLTIVTVRLADTYLPIGAGVGSATWAAHGFIGLLVSIIGFGAWRARTGSTKPIYVAVIIDALIILGVVLYGVIEAVA
ncbi:MAG: hypothetical protein F4Y12_08720 [Acidimicrobiaceae bacterium]|nr:hypothetical protein [Acidimicrobiaceae bacterium]MYA85650.1 hypothetical protein [Acidimicrobiaceae bacterium]MYB86207.1 hypothetical protein [Acidimicrobiaceae bacterium]MYH78503.1 hypothetical protein [Acidimicrobiaceae bacterium]MYH93438.1 hypothetical protein [Acidimicrobiaceae bacterium]